MDLLWFFQAIKELPPEEFERVVTGAEILETNRKGPRVFRLQEGRILKIIRHKRPLLRLGRKPRALIFARNARRLAERDFITGDVEEVFRVKHLRGHGLRYRPVPGKTLRSELREANPATRKELILAMATLLGRLHAAGVLFRSIHLANVIVTPARQLGLIDIADVRFHPLGGPLSQRQRLRNFRHLLRYREDREQLALTGWPDFLDAYGRVSGNHRHQESLAHRLPPLVQTPNETPSPGRGT